MGEDGVSLNPTESRGVTPNTPGTNAHQWYYWYCSTAAKMKRTGNVPLMSTLTSEPTVRVRVVS